MQADAFFLQIAWVYERRFVPNEFAANSELLGKQGLAVVFEVIIAVKINSVPELWLTRVQVVD